MRDTIDLGTPVLEQLAACWLIENGETFLPARRRMLAARRDDCLRLMETFFPQWQTQLPQGGLSFWVELPDALATRFATGAESRGIHLGAGTRFGLAGAFERYIRMPFTQPEAILQEAFIALQPIWSSLINQPPIIRHRKYI